MEKVAKLGLSNSEIDSELAKGIRLQRRYFEPELNAVTDYVGAMMKIAYEFISLESQQQEQSGADPTENDNLVPPLKSQTGLPSTPSTVSSENETKQSTESAKPIKVPSVSASAASEAAADDRSSQSPPLLEKSNEVASAPLSGDTTESKDAEAEEKKTRISTTDNEDGTTDDAQKPASLPSAVMSADVGGMNGSGKDSEIRSGQIGAFSSAGAATTSASATARMSELKKEWEATNKVLETSMEVYMNALVRHMTGIEQGVKDTLSLVNEAKSSRMKAPEHRNEIDDAIRQLHEARGKRKNREEYEKLACEIAKRPCRSVTEKMIDQESQKLEETQAEYSRMTEKMEFRRRQVAVLNHFHTVFHQSVKDAE